MLVLEGMLVALLLLNQGFFCFSFFSLEKLFFFIILVDIFFFCFRKNKKLPLSRSAKEVNELATTIMSDTRMMVIVQWPYGDYPIPPPPSAKTPLESSFSASSSSLKQKPTQPWSKYIIHVPHLLFHVTEEQCELLYNIVEFNVCSKADYFLGHNDILRFWVF